MSTDTVVRARMVDSDTKARATEALKAMGLSCPTSSAWSVAVDRQRGVPAWVNSWACGPARAK